MLVKGLKSGAMLPLLELGLAHVGTTEKVRYAPRHHTTHPAPRHTHKAALRGICLIYDVLIELSAIDTGRQKLAR
jgi:hypothetical protein